MTLVQSKRLDDYSMLHRDYEASATDYLTGINTLRSLPNVDANKVGIYAESEGTWITTLITKRDPSIAFTVLVSAPVFSARQQMAVGATEYLHIIGASEGTWITTLITKRDPSIAFTVLVSAPVFSARQQMAVGATEYLHIIGAPEGVEGIVPKMLSLNPGMLGLEYASFNAADYRNTLTMPLLVVYGTLDRSMPVEQGAQQLLQMAVGATEYLHIIGAPEGVEGIVPKMLSLNPGMLGLEYASFNAADYRNTLTMPLLVVYGTLDRSMPVEQGAQQLLQDANSVGNTNTMVRYYPTNHQIRLGSSLSKPGLPLPDQYTHDIESWVNAVAAGATAGDWTTPKIAGSQPFQQFAVPTDIRPGLITSFNVLVAMFVFIVLMWVVTVVLCIASHLGRKKRAHVSTDANGRTLIRVHCADVGRHGRAVHRVAPGAQEARTRVHRRQRAHAHPPLHQADTDTHHHQHRARAHHHARVSGLLRVHRGRRAQPARLRHRARRGLDLPAHRRGGLHRAAVLAVGAHVLLLRAGALRCR